MATIQKLDLTRLRIEEVFAFLQLVQSETKYLTDDLTKTAVEQLNAAMGSYDGALKDPAVVPSVSLANECDAKRDLAWTGLSANVRVLAAYHPDPDIRATGAKVEAILSKYGNPTRLPQAEESGVLHNLLQDLQALPADELRYAGLDVWIEALATAESEYLAAVATRTVEEAARVNGIVKQTRSAAENAYRQLVALVNALACANGSEPYADFVSHLNALIDRQKTVLKTRATLAAKKAEDKAEEEA